MFFPKPYRDKLGTKTWECKFIGYVENGSGYKFFHYERGLIVSRDAVFIETTNMITPIEDTKLLEDMQDQVSDLMDIDIDHNIVDSQSDPTLVKDVSSKQDIEIKNGGRKRNREPSNKLRDHYVFNLDTESDLTSLSNDPKGFFEAMKASDANQWLEATQE